MTVTTPPSTYAQPGQPGAAVQFEARYDHFIGGEYVAPASGQYFENPSPVNGKPFTEVARGNARDVDRAVEAAWRAFDSWKRTTITERAIILNKIADVMEANLEMLAVAETWDNGKPIRESLAADVPLAIDHFRYFAGAIRAQVDVRVEDQPCERARSTATPSLTTSTSRSAWSARSSPGTSRC
jgi:aldehyde dehydrogenase